MTYINAISYYLPEGVLTNEMLNEQFPEWSVDKISGKTGIYQRHIASEDEFSSDLAYEAATKLFREHQIDKEEIDFIILCTQSPDYFLPTTACILQDRLGLSKNCGAFDFNLGCSGYVYGLGIAKGLVESGQASKVLLITAETYSKFIGHRDKSNKTIFGDAAAASLVSKKEEGFKICDFVYGTDGSGAGNLIVKEGGIKHRKRNFLTTIDDYGNERSEADLYMDGSAIFVFTLGHVPKLINAVLEKHQLALGDVDLFVFHQANKFMLEHLRKKIKIEKDRFYIHIGNCGNTVSSTIPIALYEALKEGKIISDQKIMLTGFGVGLSWGGTMLSSI